MTREHDANFPRELIRLTNEVRFLSLFDSLNFVHILINFTIVNKYQIFASYECKKSSPRDPPARETFLSTCGK